MPRIVADCHGKAWNGCLDTWRSSNTLLYDLVRNVLCPKLSYQGQPALYIL